MLTAISNFFHLQTEQYTSNKLTNKINVPYCHNPNAKSSREFGVFYRRELTANFPIFGRQKFTTHDIIAVYPHDYTSQPALTGIFS